MNDQIQALKECAAIAEYHKHTSTANTARATTAALEALIAATENFIYHQPARSENFKQYQPMLEALWNLGYRYCEGCDHLKDTTKERPDQQSIALCDECHEQGRGHIRDLEAETETIDRLQAEQEPFPYDQVEVDAQQRQHEREQQIEADTIEDIKSTIEQGDIEAFLENKYSERPSRYHLSE